MLGLKDLSNRKDVDKAPSEIGGTVRYVLKMTNLGTRGSFATYQQGSSMYDEARLLAVFDAGGSSSDQFANGCIEGCFLK